MTELYSIKNEDVYKKLRNILKTRTDVYYEIKRTENGKPFIEGNPLFFSIAHSGKCALIAVSDNPVGVDLEILRGKEHTAILKSFTEREKSEIKNENDFLRHWTAREAFVKMHGAKLWEYVKSLEFFGGEIYFDGIRQNCELKTYIFPSGIAALCIQK